MNRVTMTKAEAEWFSRNVLKTLVILEAASKKDAEILDRATYKTLSSLRERATEIEGLLSGLKDEPFEVELMMSKKQKTVVRTLLDNTMKIIEDRIIPEYESRSLPDRVTETKGKLVILKALRRKFK